MKAISVKQTDEEYGLDLDGQLVCMHVNAYVEKACCPPSMSIVECGCGGMDSAVCPNPDCTGLTDNDVERIFVGAYDVCD